MGEEKQVGPKRGAVHGSEEQQTLSLPNSDGGLALAVVPVLTDRTVVPAWLGIDTVSHLP